MPRIKLIFILLTIVVLLFLAWTIWLDNEYKSPEVTLTYSSPSKKTFTVGNISFKMILIEAGTFVRKTTHTSVTLTKNYWIAETEVTFDLYRKLTGKEPYQPKNCHQCPVSDVSWHDAQEFIAVLNKSLNLKNETGFTFRLPTEAEWEFAARGGNKSKNFMYAGSDDLDEVAWHGGNSSDTGEKHESYETKPVAKKTANELGIFDMSGNLSEWCQDWYGSDYENQPYSQDPTGPAYGEMRVSRGGSSFLPSFFCITSMRASNHPSNRSDIGFRLAGTIEE